jgi:hypothetical protein
MRQKIANDSSVTLFCYENKRLGRLDQRTEGYVKGFTLRTDRGGEILNQTPNVVRIIDVGASDRHAEVGHLATLPARATAGHLPCCSA